MTNHTVQLSNGIEIVVAVTQVAMNRFGHQAIIEAANKTRAAKAARKANDGAAAVRGIYLDGELVTQL